MKESDCLHGNPIVSQSGIIDLLCDARYNWWTLWCTQGKKVLVTSDHQEIEEIGEHHQEIPGIEEHHHRDNQSNDKCGRVCM